VYNEPRSSERCATSPPLSNYAWRLVSHSPTPELTMYEADRKGSTSKGHTLSKYNILVQVDESHPVVLVAMLSHAVNVYRLLESGPWIDLEGDETFVYELLNLCE
jgi:hypothetical protein